VRLILSRTEPQARIEERITPVADILVPIFFVLVGMKVEPAPLDPFADGVHLWVAIALTVVAVVSKLVAGLAVYHPGTRRWPVDVWHGAARRSGPDLCRDRAGRGRRLAGPLFGAGGHGHDHDLRGPRVAEGPISSGCRTGIDTREIGEDT
jgi:Sodium/hydrogen exchanger family